MDFLKSTLSSATTGQTTGNQNSAVGNDNQNQQSSAVASNEQQAQEQGGGGGLFDSFKNQANNAMGGGAQGEAKEDYLDKAVDFAQSKMGAGDQSNETAAEQAKDEMISDQIRGAYKSATGRDFFVADKE